ncbi:PP2C family protein-serine/threonine phosphatase [Actinobacillus suis]|uniref:Serine/threonine protein phosphatase n=2 Tax=Actinobacillus suis TaxID=716 RepID=K0G514_ACTSU|nr:SpoIIE family protein phosphatase [Actinobacillus suis]AFU19213.1 serine/threonine protein phosphatase [Actinobacillus suis H91-0380]AIJ31352.1 protein phosphatase [Actinobacillus suis ATCC 33415]MCO4166635.1 SpoIIE family protein phosphatase [Actinobacillus suis]MCO4168084.1 SpoIIE family protein phosphatase [Actinobacillus suis]MCQ9629507.1 SpoIIE family protein phosphatase [Actinobacillus suis]
MFNIYFTQQSAKHKKVNQDALFNGIEVYQYILKLADVVTLRQESVIIGIADGVSHSTNSQLASRFFMNQLKTCENLSASWLRYQHKLFCETYSEKYWGSATTFVACQINNDGLANLVNVGNSRAYKISANGKWQQISQDHTLISILKADGIAIEDVEYSGLYNGLESCLIVDFEETDFQIFSHTFYLQQEEVILLCSDGLTDFISEKVREQIWQQYENIEEKITAYRKYVKRQRFNDDFSVIVCRR